MRVIVFVKGTAETEAGVPPTEEMAAAMMQYNEELVKAGVLLEGGGLQPSAKGARVTFRADARTVVDGPFTETKELVAGYWLWQVRSMEEAIEWARRMPNPTGNEGVVEIRPVFELDDFGPAFTPELREQEARIRQQAAVQGQTAG